MSKEHPANKALLSNVDTQGEGVKQNANSFNSGEIEESHPGMDRTESCLNCGGQGCTPASIHPVLGDGLRGDGPRRLFPAELCEECGATGRVPLGTDPLSGAPLAPDPAVPESQEVLREALTSEVDRLERLSLGLPPKGGPHTEDRLGRPARWDR